MPPFPRSSTVVFGRPSSGPTRQVSDREIDRILASLRANKVGGSYWAGQPQLPPAGYTLFRLRDSHSSSPIARKSSADARTIHAISDDAQIPFVDCDPWHLFKGAARVLTDADDELALLAAIAGIPVECVGEGPFAGLTGEAADPFDLREVIRSHVSHLDYFDPFTGDPIDFREAVELCAFWRRLIDGNRDINGAIGFAFWKRSTVAPLLWRGSSPMPFISVPGAAADGQRIAIWKARTSAAITADLERRGVRLIEVEDGFIRSAGLGADCVPPLSIIVDRLGAHFDPGHPSELEHLLQESEFPPELLDRARRVREAVVESGVSKYSAGHTRLESRSPGRRHVLVIGQVEDDRAVVSGGAGLTSNLELLRRVRAIEPDAYLLYKPHPDIEAGHRAGAIPDELCLGVADEIVRDEPISALLDLADEIHVNTSLAGFEALIRGKPVTTHGIPFYAGWGLTRDLASTPSRRTRTLGLNELVAAVLLLYPRYLDPVTGLPCPPEVLIRRLSESSGKQRDGLTVRVRRLQGRCRRGLRALLGRR